MAVKTYATSVIGASHLRKPDPVCEDSSWYDKDGIIPGAIVLAVADGHGSDQCKYSSDGSKEAVKAFYSIIKQLVEDDRFNGNLKGFKNTPFKDVELTRKISQKWMIRITHVHRKSKDRNQKFSHPSKLSPLDMVYRKAEEHDDWYWDVDPMLYGTTLLGIVIIGNDILVYQIGDGDIVIVDDDGVRNLIDGDHFLGVETYSLAHKNSWNYAKTDVVTIEDLHKKPCLIMLSSDGFANSYASEEEFHKACKDYFKVIRDNGFDAVCKAIGDDKEGWLRETSDGGCGDDISLALAYFTPDGEDKTVEICDNKHDNAINEEIEIPDIVSEQKENNEEKTEFKALEFTEVESE